MVCRHTLSADEALIGHVIVTVIRFILACRVICLVFDYRRFVVAKCTLVVLDLTPVVIYDLAFCRKCEIPIGTI